MADLKTILCVEDDPDIQAITALALESIGGFSIISCDNGSKALEVLKKKTPDLILLDVMMPDPDGVATYHALRAMPQAHAIPVIFITAKIQKHEVESYIAMGAIGVIPKPFDAMTLADEVRALWKSAEDFKNKAGAHG